MEFCQTPLRTRMSVLSRMVSPYFPSISKSFSTEICPCDLRVVLYTILMFDSHSLLGHELPSKPRHGGLW